MARSEITARPPAAPDLPRRLEVHEPYAAAVRDDAHCSEALVRELAAPGLRAAGVSVTGSCLEDADLSAAALHGLSLRDCELRRANLANVDARGGSLRRVVVEGGRLTGLTLAEGRLEDVTLRGCRADLCSFGRALLLRVVFEDCILRDCDFAETRLQSVRFERCDLSAADFGDARFTRCEVRDSRLEGVRAPARLSGVAMTLSDIVAASTTFAAALGVEVLDEPG